MSVLGKKWHIKNSDKILPVLEKLMLNRGFRPINDLREFHDPFLFKDMEKACERIEKTIADQERIIIFGDYDVDGISGTAILVHCLKKLNAAVSYRLPHRVEDGYGLSGKFIDEFAEKNIKLLITVDCGISCADVVTKAKNIGIDTIITDHHQVPEKFPHDAYAIIHPKIVGDTYPFSELTGAGVALKLAQALIKRNLQEAKPEFFESLLDLASLGTVADLGVLRDENRLIVKRGLQMLSHTKWGGLKALVDIAGVKDEDILDTSKIGYRLAPRINAAGRIGSPYTALSLLLQEENGEKSALLGKELEELNEKRKIMTESAIEEAEKFFCDGEKMPNILVAENPGWHVGILGLVASRLVERYGRPVIIMQDFGDVLVASARSPEYFNVIEAFSTMKEHFLSFGGHAQAAGFNLKKESLARFKEEIELYAEKKLSTQEFKPVLEIDCELDEQDVSFDLISEIEALKPFGIENRKPTFLMRGLRPLGLSLVGKSGEHLKFAVQIGGRNVEVIAFQMGKFAKSLQENSLMDLVFSLEINRWNSTENLQLMAMDFLVV